MKVKEPPSGYGVQVDEKQNNNSQIGHENNNNTSQKYPVEIKQSNNILNSVEDETIKAKLRNDFIRKVFSIVTYQLIITFLFIILCHTKLIKEFLKNSPILCTLLVITSIIWFIVATCVVSCNREIARKVPQNYILLFSITLSESIICSAASLQYSFDIVVTSIILTIGAATAIIMYTLKSKTDLSWVKMGLLSLASQILFFGFLNLFLKSPFLHLLYSFLATTFIAMYLVYDVQLISGKFGNEYSIDDYIFASMELYIDIIRLFLEILRIVGKLKSSN